MHQTPVCAVTQLFGCGPKVPSTTQREHADTVGPVQTRLTTLPCTRGAVNADVVSNSENECFPNNCSQEKSHCSLRPTETS